VTEWFDEFFDALAHDVWDALVPDAMSDVEADWLAGRLHLDDATPSRLLDVPSGRGRLAQRLAARGHEVVAVDFAVAAIEPLTARAIPRLNARLGDMRDLAPVFADGERFDGAWCMGNSFGYLDGPATDAFLAGVARVVRPGGRFVVDAATVAEALLPHFAPDGGEDRHEVGDVVLANVHRYDVPTSTLVTRMTLERGGERAERVVRHRVLTTREVVEALDRAGFTLERIDGDLDGTPFVPGADRCLVTVVRRGEPDDGR
jgi:SAM-dependent methyltransferase